MRKIIGLPFQIIGYAIYFIFGIWALLVNLSIVNQVAGFWGVTIAFFLLPVTLVAAPWYAIVEWGNWFPLILTYGSVVIGTIFYGIGSIIAGD